MERHVYDVQRWRELPRTHCIIEVLFGDVAGPCGGRIDRHHVDKRDPESRTIEICLVHHPMVEAVLDRLLKEGSIAREWKPCPHKPGTHRYPGAKEACERQLNASVAA